jgi:hypothetical protein
VKTIFITISRGSLIRNFFHTGVVSRLLKRDFRVVVLTPQYDTPELFKEYAHPNLHFEPFHMFKETKFRRLFIELAKGIVFNTTVHVRYIYRVGGRAPNLLMYLPRMLFFVPLRFVPGSKKILRILEEKINPQAHHDYLFEKYKPDLVFNTAAGGSGGVLKSARRFGVKSIDMPKSWDNVSKALFDSKANHMIVWGDFMKRQAVRFQDYKPEEIFVTGGPQFDFYRRKDILLSREAFCRKHGFDPKKKIILYGSAGANLTDEPPYVRLIRQFVDEGKLEDVNILVRPHLGYADDVKRFMKLAGLEGVSVDTTDEQNLNFKDKWDPSWGHIVNLYNSLYHAELGINLASTLVLDSACNDTEAMNIGFDIAPANARTKSVKRLYKSDYIQSALKTGGIWFPQSKDEFLEHLKAILERGEKKKEGQKRLIRDIIYACDGKSSERVVKTLEQLIGRAN